MFKEYLNKKCYVTVSLTGSSYGGSDTFYGLITEVSDKFITMNVDYISSSLITRKSKCRNSQLGKTTINSNYIIMISEEI